MLSIAWRVPRPLGLPFPLCNSNSQGRPGSYELCSCLGSCTMVTAAMPNRPGLGSHAQRILPTGDMHQKTVFLVFPRDVLRGGPFLDPMLICRVLAVDSQQLFPVG